MGACRRSAQETAVPLLRRNAAYDCGVISFTPPPLHVPRQRRQQDQVVETEVGPPRRHDPERVRLLDVGPAGRQGANPNFPGLAEEDPMLTPGVAVASEFVLSAAQWMERVRYTESLPTVADVGS